MDPVVVAEGVVKRFGWTVALNNVSFRAYKGLNLVVGPNGSGKTTLLKIMAGLLRPSRGRVRVLGLDPWRYRSRLLSTASMAIEGYPLPWWMSGREFARHVSRLWGVPFESLMESFEYFGVTDYWERPLRGYSSGMRKKVHLAVGLVLGRSLYIVDEPFSYLDQASIELAVQRINRLAREASIVMATHIVPPGMAGSREILLLVGGEAVREPLRDAPLWVAEVRTGSREEAHLIASIIEERLPGVGERLFYTPRAGIVRVELLERELREVRDLLEKWGSRIYLNPNLVQLVSRRA